MSTADEAIPDAGQLAALFDHQDPVSFGVEEEFMLLDPTTLDLSPRAAELLGNDPAGTGARLELPASQVEMATEPSWSLQRLADELYTRRVAIAGALSGKALLASAGTHPFAGTAGVLNRSARYQRLHAEYGQVAEHQLVCGMHVHVRIAGEQRALGVYNALRSHLPDLAALGANAPYYAGVDTGMASVRPLVSGLLPRQGVPPVLESWRHYARELQWAHRAGRIGSAREWWWELRPHPQLGTIEVRVLDAQVTADEAAALAGTVAALTVWLAARHDAGDLPPGAESWRISENRWSAARHGLEAPMVDVHTGTPAPARERLSQLLDQLEGSAAPIGATRQLARARSLLRAGNGAARQRQRAARRGVGGLAAWLAQAFLTPPGQR